jgi:hypothetical protein
LIHANCRRDERAGTIASIEQNKSKIEIDADQWPPPHLPEPLITVTDPTFPQLNIRPQDVVGVGSANKILEEAATGKSREGVSSSEARAQRLRRAVGDYLAARIINSENAEGKR